MIVVTVDLGLHEESWRRARVKVVVTDGDDVVLLASEPTWRGDCSARCSRPPNSPSARRPGAAPRRAARSASPNYVYIAGTPHLRNEVKVGFRSWRLTYFPTLEGVRAQVNAVLALVVMAIAHRRGAGLLPAVAAHPRREPAHPARIRGAAPA